MIQLKLVVRCCTSALLLLLVVEIAPTFAQDDANRVATVTERANSATQRGDHTAAMSAYAKLIELQPQRPVLRVQLAIAQLNAGLPQQAAATLGPLARDAELLDPEIRQRSASLLAMARIRSGQLDGIRTDIQRVSGTLQRQLWLELALRLEEADRWDEAIDAYGSVLEIDPADRETAILRSQMLARIGRHRDAESFLINLSETLPDSNAVWYELGVVREALSDPLGAASAYRKASSLAPGDETDEDGRVKGMVALASMQRTDEPDTALNLLRQAHQLYPSRFEPLAMQARILADREAFGDAVESAAAAVSLAPERTDLRNLLGNSYYLAGNYAAAVQTFEALLQEHPQLTAVSDNLALARRMMASGPVPPQPAARTGQRPSSAQTEPSTDHSSRTPTNSTTDLAALPLGLQAAPFHWTQTGRTVLRVEAVEAASKAQRCGLEAGDLLIRVQGTPTTSLEQVEAALAGDTQGLRIDIVRESQPRALVCI